MDGEVIEITTGGKEKTLTILIDPEKRGKKKDDTVTYNIPHFRTLKATKGDKVKKGDLLTDGPVSPSDLFLLSGRIPTERYIMKETHKIYEMQGAAISRKHIEVIVRQMFSRKKVTNPGDTRFVVGEIVEDIELRDENQKVEKKSGEQATVSETILGISEVSLNTASFLAAASFENTQRVLTETAISGGIDRLRGIKENVLIGRLIPAGTGLPSRRAEFEPEPKPYEFEEREFEARTER